MEELRQQLEDLLLKASTLTDNMIAVIPDDNPYDDSKYKDKYQAIMEAQFLVHRALWYVEGDLKTELE